MSKILQDLNPQQQEAVKAVDGPVIVFAGAGTGKTRTLTSRIAYMISERKIPPKQILAITFTKKATNEMRERIFKLVGPNAGEVFISTIHAFCASVLRKFIGLIGYKQNFEIIDDEDSVRVLTEIYKERNFDRKAFSPKAAHNIISAYKNGVMPIGGIVNTLFEAYQEYLFDHNLADFDDLLLLVNKLFTLHKEVLEFYQERFRYILVDEFQDTNMTQYEIIKTLGQKYQNVFVVGDDDQSIYSFRGAVVDNMYAFMKDFDNVILVKLTQNYRSSNALLLGANTLIANNVLREKKNLFSTVKGELSDVVVTESQYHEDEVRFVVNEIAYLIRGGVDPNKIAVLYRNNVVSRNFELAFVEARIPYLIYGGFSYLKRREIKDAISYLKFLLEPNNIFHFKRIINQPSRGIGEKTVEKITERCQMYQQSIFEAIDWLHANNPSNKTSALIEFKQLIEKLQKALEQMSLVDFFDYMLEQTGYLEMLAQEDFFESNRVENLEEFKSILYRFEATYEREGLSKKEILHMGFDEILLDETLSVDDKGKGGAVLSTVHSAKGLEFDYVFVVALEEGLFPALREDSDIEEERRVAYVAFTRAKKKIYLSCATTRLIYGRIVRNPKSRFLTEYLMGRKEQEKPEILKTEKLHSDESLRDFHVSDRIYHSTFGYGLVIAVDETTIQVLFERDKSIRKIKKDHPTLRKTLEE